MKYEMENMVKLSPREMKGSIWDDIGKTKIVQILISSGESGVVSIKFVYVEDGKVLLSEMHGEPSGFKFDVVTFDYPEEFLVSVSSEHHSSGSAWIAFGTNKRTYGPFGKMTNFEPNTFGKFAYNFGSKSSFGGFHGSVQDLRVHTIGIYIRPLASLAELSDTDSDYE